MSIQNSILEHISTAILVFDSALYLCFMNPAAEFALSTSDNRILGLHIADIFTGNDGRDSALDGLHRACDNGHCYSRREAVLQLLNGHTLTADYMITPIDDGQQRYLLMEFQPRDRLLKIHEEESLQAKQETAQILVRGLAHEIKNPLGGVRGAAQLLERELPNPALKEYTSIIIEEADRLRNLVDSMLGPTRPPTLGHSNIHEVLERVCGLINGETENALVLVRDYDPSIPEMAMDAEQMIQAVLNVVRNAMQAIAQTMPLSEGSIILRTRILRQFTIGSVRHRIVCQLDIEDNGPGIPQTIRDKIFYPMISGRADGSGLGLSIAQAILGQHKGIITCESMPGRTCFSLFIPMGCQDHAHKPTHFSRSLDLAGA